MLGRWGPFHRGGGRWRECEGESYALFRSCSDEGRGDEIDAKRNGMEEGVRVWRIRDTKQGQVRQLWWEDESCGWVVHADTGKRFEVLGGQAGEIELLLLCFQWWD